VPSDSLEGQNLGKYRVLEPLGRGGMARVYRAYHPQLDRYVAIKVLRSDLVDEEEFLARFKREARAVATLRHPNIVQVFDADTRGDLYYMVMELLEGDTLATRLTDYRARGERMPWGEVVRILLDVLDGLAYAHSEGMIHRDVKPANILLTRRGQAVLTDFGIAQIVGGTKYTVTGALMGTLAYMAPEQGLEGQCDARSDIYALGIVFYEMLVGEPPYDAETPLAILMKHVNDPLPLPRQHDPSIPLPFERVILKALAKRPGDRYQMAQALRSAAQEASIELPGRISLPLSFTTPEAPSESVAVLSGTARDKVRDAEFAADDTDAALGKKLASEAAAEAAAGVAAMAAGSGDRKVDRLMNKAARLQRKAARRAASHGMQVQIGAVSSRQGTSAPAAANLNTILNAVALLVGFNLVAVFAGIISHWWGIFGRGWPFELLLVGLLLAGVMDFTGSIWLLIPAGILLGNGVLFSFYSITTAWPLWALLWPLEPLLVGGVIWYTIRLAGDEERASQVARDVAQRVRRPMTVLAVVVAVLGLFLGGW
jgi:tRNA A-37 threonylcarbamoyl transferase component Bud32